MDDDSSRSDFIKKLKIPAKFPKCNIPPKSEFIDLDTISLKNIYAESIEEEIKLIYVNLLLLVKQAKPVQPEETLFLLARVLSKEDLCGKTYMQCCDQQIDYANEFFTEFIGLMGSCSTKLAINTVVDI